MEESQKEYFIEILKQYRLGNATTKEIAFLEAYYNVFEINDDLITTETQKEFDQVQKLIKINVDKQINYHKKTVSLTTGWMKYAVAAAVIFALSIATYYFKKPDSSKDIIAAQYSHISPGTNKATLTLSNGKKILLDDVANGEIAKQPGIRITKNTNGQIVYHIIDESSGSDLSKNTISTPKGGQYQVILPDGTKVFLNAASTLSYPATFHGAERLVELSGEAYFEVTKSKHSPFKIRSGQQIVEVLGTHFNINAYADERFIKTTLLEGSIKVSSEKEVSIITPGQQAILNKGAEGGIITAEVNTDKVIAWKNGVFSFENEDLKSIMRQISRWYDVTVVYEGVPSDEKYYGEISRNSKLAEVFKILELNNVHFDVAGKTIKVSSNQGSPTK